MQYLNKINFSNKKIFIKIMIISLIILFGLHLRNVVTKDTIVDTPIRGDAIDYFFYAKNIDEHHVFSRQNTLNEPTTIPKADALRSPGFPLFASFFFKKDNFDSTLNNTLIAQTLLQIIVISLFSYLLINLLGFAWGSISILLIWTFPHFITINTYYLSESLFASLLVLALFIVWITIEKKINVKIGLLIAGFLIGLSALTRPVMEYFPFFLLILFLIFDRSKIKNYYYFLIAALLPIIIWKVRNYIEIGELSDPTLMINGLYHGSFPNFMYENKPETLGYAYRFDPRQNEVYNGIGATLNLIFERFKSSPITYLSWYIFGKQTFLWQWTMLEGAGEMFIYPVIQSPYTYLVEVWTSYKIHRFIHPMWVIIGLLGSLSLPYLWKNKIIKIHPILLIMSLLIIYTIIMHAITAPYPRYSIPFKLFLIPLSIWSIRETIKWVRLKSTL
jgi:4-amino-4-deoxy-L-arabinose transferase-like glycosyltransferase